MKGFTTRHHSYCEVESTAVNEIEGGLLSMQHKREIIKRIQTVMNYKKEKTIHLSTPQLHRHVLLQQLGSQ